MAIQFSSYVEGPDFIGRSELCDKIVDNLKIGQSTSVVGFPGVGLTSVFKAVTRRLAALGDTSTIYVAVTLNQSSDSNRLFRILCTELRNSLEKWSTDDEDKEWALNDILADLEVVSDNSVDYDSLLSRALIQCKESLELKVVFLIDRFHHVGSNLTSESYSGLKAKECRYVIFSYKGIRQIEDEVAVKYSQKPSSFWEKFDENYCGAFTAAEYEEYIKYVEAQFGKKPSKSLREHFGRFAGNFPSLLNRIVYQLGSKSGSDDVDAKQLQQDKNLRNVYDKIYEYILNLHFSVEDVRDAEELPRDYAKRRIDELSMLVNGGGDNRLAPLREHLVEVGILRQTSGGNCEFFAPEFKSFFFSRYSGTLDFISLWNRVEPECRALCFAALDLDRLNQGFEGNITDYLLSSEGYFGDEYFAEEILQNAIADFRRLLNKSLSRSDDDGTRSFPTQPSHLWNLFIDYLWGDFCNVFSDGQSADWEKGFKEIVSLRNLVDHNNLCEVEDAKESGAYARAVKACEDIIAAIDNYTGDLKGVQPYFPHPSDNRFRGKMLVNRKGPGFIIFHDGKPVRVDKNEKINGMTPQEVGDGINVKYGLKTVGSNFIYAVRVEED